MVLPSAERRLLTTQGLALGVRLDDAQLEGLGTYLDHLEKWNRRVNLVAGKDRRELLERHVVDSLAAAPFILARNPAARLVDIGSGGGLPGVPLAIACASTRVTLVEPRRKKASFLRLVARECSTWNIEVEARRIQDLVEDRSGEFDIAVSRAAFPPEELTGVAKSLLRPGGCVMGFTTDRTAAPPGARRGFGAPEDHSYQLPGRGGSFRLTIWPLLE